MLADYLPYIQYISIFVGIIGGIFAIRSAINKAAEDREKRVEAREAKIEERIVSAETNIKEAITDKLEIIDEKFKNVEIVIEKNEGLFEKHVASKEEDLSSVRNDMKSIEGELKPLLEKIIKHDVIIDQIMPKFENFKRDFYQFKSLVDTTIAVKDSAIFRNSNLNSDQDKKTG